MRDLHCAAGSLLFDRIGTEPGEGAAQSRTHHDPPPVFGGGQWQVVKPLVDQRAVETGGRSLTEALRILPGRLRNVRLDGEASWRAATGISRPTALPLAFEPV
jgi:hypothetical protein